MEGERKQGTAPDRNAAGKKETVKAHRSPHQEHAGVDKHPPVEGAHHTAAALFTDHTELISLVFMVPRPCARSLGAVG